MSKLIDNEINNWKEIGKFFDFKNFKIFFKVEGQGLPLLILHGYPYNSFEWFKVWPELTGRFKVITFDLPGLGFSDKPQKHTYSFEAYAQLTNALLKHLEIKEVHILAHDLGVSVAQELLALNQDRKNDFTILSIAFVNGGLFTSVYKPRLIQVLLSKSPKPIGGLLAKLITKKTTNAAVKKLFGPHTQPTEEFLDKQWEILNYNNGKSITHLIGKLVFDKINYQMRWIAAMQTTHIPLCYICGPLDPNSGTHMADEYIRLIPKANVKFLSNHIGHWPQLEAPEDFLSLYFLFITECEFDSSCSSICFN